MSIPLTSCRRIFEDAAAALVRRARLEVKWWIAHLMIAAVSEDSRIETETEDDDMAAGGPGRRNSVRETDGAEDGNQRAQLAPRRYQTRHNCGGFPFEHGFPLIEHGTRDFKPHPSQCSPHFVLSTGADAKFATRSQIATDRDRQADAGPCRRLIAGQQFHHHLPRHLHLCTLLDYPAQQHLTTRSNSLSLLHSRLAPEAHQDQSHQLHSMHQVVDAATSTPPVRGHLNLAIAMRAPSDRGRDSPRFTIPLRPLPATPLQLPLPMDGTWR